MKIRTTLLLMAGLAIMLWWVWGACADSPTFGTADRTAWSVSFDGGDDFLLINNPIAFDFTVAGWTKTTQGGGGWGLSK